MPPWPRAAAAAATAANPWRWRRWRWRCASEEGQVPLRDLVLRGGVEEAVAHEMKGAHTAGVHHLGRGREGGGDNWVRWCAG